MAIYASGWVLQIPALNFFKKFLRLNPSVSLSGIIYPKKIPEDIDGIPVFDFDHAKKIIAPGDIVLDCHRPGPNDLLHAAFQEFFSTLNISMTSVSDFLGSLIQKDHENRLRIPVDGVQSRDIHDLLKEAPFEFVKDKFADLQSFEVAKKLDEIARSSDWDNMLVFDKDEIPEEGLFDVISDLYRLGPSRRCFRVLEMEDVFLNALLKLRVQHPEAPFSVELAESVLEALGPRCEFYRRSLRISEISDSQNELLLGATNTISAACSQEKRALPSIFFMPRSILDCRRFLHSLKGAEYRVMLRQPDTSPSSLIAALMI